MGRYLSGGLMDGFGIHHGQALPFQVYPLWAGPNHHDHLRPCCNTPFQHARSRRMAKRGWIRAIPAEIIGKYSYLFYLICPHI